MQVVKTAVSPVLGLLRTSLAPLQLLQKNGRSDPKVGTVEFVSPRGLSFFRKLAADAKSPTSFLKQGF